MIEDTEPHVQRLLIASGGAFKGAYQVPILRALTERGAYDAMLGTSVGSINLSLAAQDKFDVLEGFWDDLDTKDPWLGIPGFLKPLWWKALIPFAERPEGLFSIEPVRALLEKHVDPTQFRCVYGCGIVIRDEGKHITAIHGRHSDTVQKLHDHILASSAMCGIMAPIRCGLGSEALVDGGHKHVIPTIPERWLHTVKEIDVVFCQVLDEGALPDPEGGALSNLLWGIEVALHNTALEDLEDLRELAAAGKKVRVWAPTKSLGGMLDASARTIARRTQAGREDIDRPVIL
jgi:predicted acylesterase/phospholipase RssA